jgi:hypothetical protein
LEIYRKKRGEAKPEKTDFVFRPPDGCLTQSRLRSKLHPYRRWHDHTTISANLKKGNGGLSLPNFFRAESNIAVQTVSRRGRRRNPGKCTDLTHFSGNLSGITSGFGCFSELSSTTREAER